MSENMGELSWSARIKRQQFTADLAAMDAEWQAKVQKWEQPVGVGGMAMGRGTPGGGASGGGGGPTTGMSGPNISGTSNGDVTWRLSDAVQNHQYRNDQAVGRSRRMGMSPTDEDDPRIGDLANDYVSGGRMRMALGESRFQGRRAISLERQQDAMNEALGGSRIRMAMSDAAHRSQQDYREGVFSAQQEKYDQLKGAMLGGSRIRMAMSDAKSNAVLQRQQEVADDLKQEFGQSQLSSKDPNAVEKTSLWKTKIPIQHLIRGTVYGLVVDAVAGMVGNEAQYQQGMTLAGNNQGAQAKANLQRLTGGIGSVPLIGGILNNLISPFTTPIDTQNQLADRQIAFGDMRMQAGYGRAAANETTRSINFGPNSVSAGLAAINAERIEKKAEIQTNNEKMRVAWDQAHPMPTLNDWARDARYGDYSSGDSNRGYQAELIARNLQQRQFSTELNRNMDAQLAPLNAGADQLMRTGQFNLAMTTSGIDRMKLENQYRPTAGAAAQDIAQGKAIRSYYQRNGATSLDIETGGAMINQLIQSAMGRNKDIVENYRWGEVRQYNPYIQSPLTFTDRAPETQADKLDANTQAINALTEQFRLMTGHAP